jgi:hypothetical protein
MKLSIAENYRGSRVKSLRVVDEDIYLVGESADAYGGACRHTRWWSRGAGRRL